MSMWQNRETKSEQNTESSNKQALSNKRRRKTLKDTVAFFLEFKSTREYIRYAGITINAFPNSAGVPANRRNCQTTM